MPQLIPSAPHAAGVPDPPSPTPAPPPRLPAPTLLHPPPPQYSPMGPVLPQSMTLPHPSLFGPHVKPRSVQVFLRQPSDASPSRLGAAPCTAPPPPTTPPHA